MNTAPRDLVGLVLVVAAVMVGSQWWAARSRNTVGEEVATLARAGDIRMLSSDTCSICVAARAWFTQHRIEFSECSIERDAACQRDFAATLSPGTPVLLVRGHTLVGFSPERVRSALL